MPPTPPRTVQSRNSQSRPFTPLLLLTFLLPLFALLFPYSSYISSTSDIVRLSNAIPPKSNGRSPTALILTAHPDDEVMFFSPTILSLVNGGWQVKGLCLSTGNSSGLGDVRIEELYKSYEALGVSRKGVKVINQPKLQDSMTLQWNTRLAADIIENHISNNQIDVIITFDAIGITNHPNHIAIPKALSLLKSTASSPRILHLKSPAVIPKFTGPFYPIYLGFRRMITKPLGSLLSNQAGTEETKIYILISTPSQWYQSIKAMMYHESQLVWFRWLYLAASRLMWVNELIQVS